MNNQRPIRTDSQILGDIGEASVQLIFKKFSWTADIIKSDYGEDIDCNIFIDNARTNYHFRCQVKSTKKDSEYVREISNGNYSISIESSILKAWLTSYFPVFLVIYEEDSDLCYWCNPVEQVLNNPAKLGKEKPTIQVLKKNKLDLSSKNDVLEEVKRFYRKILRLDESKIECQIIPVLMPNYRVVPFDGFYNFINNDCGLSSTISGNYIELLPSWMSVLKRIDPSSNLSAIKLQSENTDLDVFFNNLKLKLNSFKYSLKKGEWLSFIISPINIKSKNSSWMNELTHWTTYSKIGKKIVTEFDYSFEQPNNFLRQVTRRARSWDYFHFVNPKRDLAIQFFGAHEITPNIKSIDQTHDQNIRGQFVLWECKKNEIEKLAEIISKFDLTIQIVDETKDETMLAITTPLFDPFIGLYSLPRDWDSFENGNARTRLTKNNLWSMLPGSEYTGKMPDFLEEAVNKYANKKYKTALVTEMEYTPGFPLMLDERVIQVSRFQMVAPNKIENVEELLAKSKKNPLKLKNSQMEFELIDDSMWNPPIYELSLSWTPEISNSSKESFEEIESSILKIFDEILPSTNEDSLLLKNTCDILHLAGEIGFENYDI